MNRSQAENQEDYIVIRELFNGDGNYEFDWTVTAVRKGYEDFEVIRPKGVYELGLHPEAFENGEPGDAGF